MHIERNSEQTGILGRVGVKNVEGVVSDIAGETMCSSVDS